jgi:putative flippase GtrA
MQIGYWQRHLRQTSLFVLVGLAQLALDTGVFIATTALGVPVAAGALLGRISGAVFGFWLNGRYTFGVPRLDRQHAARFALAWTLLTIVSTLSITAIAARLGLHYAWLAKPMVEAVLAAINFLISRHWIYR